MSVSIPNGYSKVAIVEMGGVDYNFALFNENIAPGDLVIVSGKCSYPIIIDEIVDKKDATCEKITAEVVAKVDKSDYESYQKRITDMNTLNSLKRKMEKEKQKMIKEIEYERCAALSDDFREIYSEYLLIKNKLNIEQDSTGGN